MYGVESVFRVSRYTHIAYTGTAMDGIAACRIDQSSLSAQSSSNINRMYKDVDRHADYQSKARSLQLPYAESTPVIL